MDEGSSDRESAQPGRQQIDRQWEAIHLSVERYHKGGERPHGPPFPPLSGAQEAEPEEDEDPHMEEQEMPKTVLIGFVHPIPSPARVCMRRYWPRSRSDIWPI